MSNNCKITLINLEIKTSFEIHRLKLHFAVNVPFLMANGGPLQISPRIHDKMTFFFSF